MLSRFMRPVLHYLWLACQPLYFFISSLVACSKWLEKKLMVFVKLLCEVAVERVVL